MPIAYIVKLDQIKRIVRLIPTTEIRAHSIRAVYSSNLHYSIRHCHKPTYSDVGTSSRRPRSVV